MSNFCGHDFSTILYNSTNNPGRAHYTTDFLPEAFLRHPLSNNEYKHPAVIYLLRCSSIEIVLFVGSIAFYFFPSFRAAVWIEKQFFFYFSLSSKTFRLSSCVAVGIESLLPFDKHSNKPSSCRLCASALYSPSTFNRTLFLLARWNTEAAKQSNPSCAIIICYPECGR